MVQVRKFTKQSGDVHPPEVESEPIPEFTRDDEAARAQVHRVEAIDDEGEDQRYAGRPGLNPVRPMHAAEMKARAHPLVVAGAMLAGGLLLLRLLR